MKSTVASFKKAKENGKKLSMLTAYDYTTARLVDTCGVDGILVGDSLGMVCLGYKDTLRVTMEDMIHHTRAVARGTQNAMLVADMPFMSYHASVHEAVKNAGRLVQEAGAEAVKLEGGSNVLPKIEAIVKAQMPVMGHLGLTPQSVHTFGGFKVQGKDKLKAMQILDDAKRLEGSGVFAIVLECVPKQLAERITQSVHIPTIGIGAGKACDGQILVYHDMIGLYGDMKPKFVKVYENAGMIIQNGIRKYINEVQNGIFPCDEHTFTMDDKIHKDFDKQLETEGEE